MLLYDNFEDCKTKLSGTYVYYDGKAAFVKDVFNWVDEHTGAQTGEYGLGIITSNSRNRSAVKLSDPKLNYMDFNLGYANYGDAAVWWFRIPNKQYSQGLRYNQLGRYSTSMAHYQNAELNWSKPSIDMLENRYPKFSLAEEWVKTDKAAVQAFHKDFAISWEPVHKDLILEYKGKQVGHFTDPKHINLLDEYKHLTEAIREAVA